MPEVITNQLVKSLMPRDKVYEIRDKELNGLVLRVHPTGRMVYFCVYGRGKRIKLGVHPAMTPTLARDAAKKVLGQTFIGEDPGKKCKQDKTITFKRFLDEVYRPWLESNLRTGKDSARMLEVSFKAFHTLKLFEITPWQVEKWRMGRQKDGVKASTINKQLALLKACLRRATEWQWIDIHPIEKVKHSQLEKEKNVRYLRPDEEERLRESLNKREDRIRLERKQANLWRAERGYKQFPNLDRLTFADYLMPVVLLSMNTGLRRGEVFGMRWKDVDLANRILSVPANTAKSGETRHLPLNGEAFQVLSDWKNQSQDDAAFVFEGKSGKPFHDVRKSWAKVLKDAKIKDFRWHDLRHHFASRLVQEGVDLNTVRELLGHSDYKMTLRYAHLAPEHKRAAVEKILVSAGS